MPLSSPPAAGPPGTRESPWHGVGARARSGRVVAGRLLVGRVALTGAGGGAVIVAPACGRLPARWGPAWVLPAALFTLAGALWLASFLRPDRRPGAGPGGDRGPGRRRPRSPRRRPTRPCGLLSRLPAGKRAVARVLSWIGVVGAGAVPGGQAGRHRGIRWLLRGSAGRSPSCTRWGRGAAGAAGGRAAGAAGAGSSSPPPKACASSPWATAGGWRCWVWPSRAWPTCCSCLLGMSLPDVSPEARAATVLFLWPMLLPGRRLCGCARFRGGCAAIEALLRRDHAQPGHARAGARRAAGGGGVSRGAVAAVPAGRLRGVRAVAGRGGGGGGRAPAAAACRCRRRWGCWWRWRWWWRWPRSTSSCSARRIAGAAGPPPGLAARPADRRDPLAGRACGPS